MCILNLRASACALAAALSLSLGCSQTANTSPKDAKDAETLQTAPAMPASDRAAGDTSAGETAVLERRDAFTQQARQRLDDLNDAIVILAVQIHEHGDERQRAEWGPWLISLDQELNRLDTEVIHARDVDSPARLARRHAQLERELETLEAALDRTGWAIVEDLGAGPRPARGAPSGPAPEVDLCHLQVKGAGAQVHEEGELLILQLTAPSAAAVAELQQRTERLLQTTGTTHLPPGLMQVIATEDGVLFVFVAEAGQMESTRAQLEEATEQLQQRRC